MFFQFRFWAIAAIALLMATSAFAGGNIGFTFNQIIDDRSGGLIGEYEYEGQPFDFEVDGQLQFGNIYRGKAHAEITFDLGRVGLKPFVDVGLKGYTLDTLGNDKNAGLALTVPVGDLNFDIGIFGSNAGPWGSPNALDALVPKGYDETQLEGLGLADVHPAPKGLPSRVGNSLNALVATGFEKGDVEIKLKGIFELLGEGDKAHQLISRFETSRNLFGDVDVIVGAEVGFMLYQDVIYYETAILTTLGYEF